MGDEPVASNEPWWVQVLRPHLNALELDWPTTRADIKRAYRRLALVHHPDMDGGDHDAFIRIKIAVDEAVALLDQYQSVESAA